MADFTRFYDQIDTFWTSSPWCWFVKLETNFELWGIKDERIKFSTVLSRLNLDAARQISDYFENPVTKDSYEEIKELLISRCSRLELSKIELDGKKPSELLRDIKCLATTKEMAVEALWRQYLPKSLQERLVDMKESNLEDQANFADIYMETHSSELSTTVKELKNENSDILDKITKMQQSINLLHAKLNRLLDTDGLVDTLADRLQDTVNFQDQSTNRRSRSRRRNSRSRSKSSFVSNDLCYYHQKFGKNAYRCESPCAWYD